MYTKIEMSWVLCLSKASNLLELLVYEYWTDLDYMYIPNSVAKTLQTKTPDLNKYCDRNYMSWIETKFCHIIGNHGELLFLKDHFYFYPPTFSHARCISYDVHITTHNNCQSGIYPALHKTHLLPPIFLPSLFPLMFLYRKFCYINLYALSWPISN